MVHASARQRTSIGSSDRLLNQPTKIKLFKISLMVSNWLPRPVSLIWPRSLAHGVSVSRLQCIFKSGLRVRSSAPLNVCRNLVDLSKFIIKSLIYWVLIGVVRFELYASGERALNGVVSAHFYLKFLYWSTVVLIFVFFLFSITGELQLKFNGFWQGGCLKAVRRDKHCCGDAFGGYVVGRRRSVFMLFVFTRAGHTWHSWVTSDRSTVQLFSFRQQCLFQLKSTAVWLIFLQ